MRSLEGASCAELLPWIADKYFDCNVQREKFNAATGLAICGNCVALEACRDEALNMASAPQRGVIAGVQAHEMRAARSWRRYEQGVTEKVPRAPRPGWLAMTDATEEVERTRLDDDPEEPRPEI